jgi:hypothetical protein
MMAGAAQGIQTQPLPFEDFSGGMTDYYLGCPLTKYQQAENLLIVKHGQIGKLFTRPGSEIYDDDYYQIPAGAQRVGTLKYFEDQLFIHSARKLYYIASGWQTLQGPTSNDLLPSGVDTTTVLSMASWNKHLFVTSSDLTQRVQKIYKDGSAAWQLRTAGMPELASAPVPTGGTPGATFSYLYRFVYRYQYTVGTRTYIDRGPATEVTATNNTAIAAGAANTISWASIPAIDNTTVHNYATASTDLDVEIYRTTNGGVNFFLVSSVNNGTTTYADTMTDAALQTQEPLYTEDGSAELAAPPLCKVLHIVDDVGLYGHCKVGSEILANRVYQSVPGDPDGVPEDFFADLKDSVVALSSFRSVAVALGESMCFRLDGRITEVGTGDLTPTTISEVIGCVSSQSVVQTPDGIFFAGLDGFYWTDGYQVFRVSDGIDRTYQTLVSTAEKKRRIVGKYDSKKKRVWWTAQVSDTEVDTCFVLDLNFGINADMPFTTATGTSFSPTALEFIGENLIRGHKSGYIFNHDDSLFVDPKVNTSVTPDAWNSETIMYDFLSAATNFGTSFERKWVPRISVICEDQTNLSLQINSINDDGRKIGELKPIRYRGAVTWGDPDVYWGDPDLVWNYQGIIDEARRFPAQNLRCEYKQIQLTNAFVAIISSDTLGLATVNTSAHTATLDDTAAFDWPSLAVDYYISFESDGYTREFPITARTNDVVTFTDTGSTAINGSQGWVLRGYPKGEVLYLNSFTIHYAIFGKTQTQYRSSGTGEPGASD